MINKLKFIWKRTLTVALLILTASFSLNLLADDHESARKLVESGDIVPLETILEQLQNRVMGRVIEVELEQKKGRLVYEIEQVDEHGVVREYIFDAVDGSLLKEKIED
jgi:uncharacterized membrane protein YkoI